MENVKSDIEKAFLSIFRSSTNKMELPFFDFYTALKLLERNNDKDFSLYIGVFKDLFSVVGHTWTEYKSITPKGNKYIVFGEYHSIFNNSKPKTEQFERDFTKMEIKQRFKTLDIKLNESPTPYPITKLFFLYPAIGKWEVTEKYKLSKYIESKQKLNTEYIVFEQFIKELEMKYSEVSQPKIKIIKPFFEYLLHTKPDLLANELKAKFSTEKGKGIRLMIKVLQENKPELLIIGNRQKKEIYTALTTFFSRDIGTYQGVFDCNINEKKADRIDLQSTKTKIDFILKTISK